MSIATIRKIRNNLELVNLVKPAKTSPYRATAEAIIQQYASQEITNFKTCLNLVLKFGSKRPEVTAKKFNDYIEANKPNVIEQSKLDFSTNDDDIVAPIESKKNYQLLKSLFQQNYIIGLLEQTLMLLPRMRRPIKAE
jgi:hypothetical protein